MFLALFSVNAGALSGMIKFCCKGQPHLMKTCGCVNQISADMIKMPKY
jgi:hypothetical protein